MNFVTDEVKCSANIEADYAREQRKMNNWGRGAWWDCKKANGRRERKRNSRD